MDTKSRVRLISFILLICVFTAWAVFYAVMSVNISDSAERQVALAAGQIIERLGVEFSEAEHMSYELKQDANIQALVSEDDRGAFFEIAAAVGTGGIASNPGFVSSVVLFGADGHAYRLTGAMGNRACGILYNAVSRRTLPSHLSVKLDGTEYIGYADRVASGGIIAFLTEEEKILEILRAYDQSGSLFVMISAGGEAVISNTDRTEWADNTARPVINASLGVTPYEISVAADPAYMNASVKSFSAVAAITAAFFAAALFLYMRVLNRRFFRPMVGVIGSIKQLQTENPADSLPYVQSMEFDDLIDKINEMLRHIAAKNGEVLVAEMKAKNAEIGRQKALVFSLQKQINAHFTVNTLEAIRTNVEKGELHKAEALMSGLTRIVRYAHSKDEMINVWDELEILKYYANIMSSRYGGKLTADFDFDEDLMDTDMPRMLLQPLIENAVEHGFKGMDSGCAVTVKAELITDTIRFTVSDNGGGMSAEDLAALRERLNAAPGAVEGLNNIALLNIRNRLYYYYGERARLSVSANDGGGIAVALEMPVSVKNGGAE